MAPSIVTRVAFKNILFATDFSNASQHALLHALAMAKRFDAKLTVMHVAPPETQVPIPMEPVLLEADWHISLARESMRHLEDFEPLHMYPHDTVLKQGNAWPEMAGVIEDRNIDLIVLGTHGRGADWHALARLRGRAGTASRHLSRADRGARRVANAG